MENHVKNLIKELAGTQTKFAEMLGISQPSVQYYVENGSLPNKTSKKLLDLFPQLSSRYVLSGEGPMYKCPDKKFYNLTTLGELCNINDKVADGHIEVPSINADFFFTYFGSAVPNVVDSGDILGVRLVKEGEYTDPDKIYLVNVRDIGFVFKHIRYAEDKEIYYLLSCSSIVNTMTIPKRDVYEIYNVVFIGKTL